MLTLLTAGGQLFFLCKDTHVLTLLTLLPELSNMQHPDSVTSAVQCRGRKLSCLSSTLRRKVFS